MNSDDWFRTERRDTGSGDLFLKPGVRGYPDLPPGSETIRRLKLSGSEPFLDLSGTAGLAALQASGVPGRPVAVLDGSAAALSCLRQTFAGTAVAASAGLAWDAWPEGVQTVLLQPPADRGGARVELELRAAAARLPADGRLLLLGHRDRGAKRYEKLAAGLFRSSEVSRRDSGTRLLECRAPLREQAEPEPLLSFTAAGLELQSLKGVFAAGKLDPGTAQLLEALGPTGWLSGRRVLDPGCGYGLLGLLAAAAGADCVAVDDDLAAVRSTRLNAERLGLSASLTALHSDLDAELGSVERFDTVLMNPPFHVGRGVRLELPRAFIRAARRRLRPGGELWLVANRALPYEQLLADWSEFRTVRDEAGFKVLRAQN